MRILDRDSNKTINNVILYLSEDEASVLQSSLQNLLEKPENNHTHINNPDFTKEITVCIYDPGNLTGFDERSKKVIMSDE
jgi:helix-turn-helix protein